MGQEYDKFPKTDVGSHQPEQIWRDWEMFNIHINAHKQRWLKDVVDIMDCHRLEEDFCGWPDTSFDWNLHEAPGASGIEAVACTDVVNGVLKLKTDNHEYAHADLTQMCECWKFVNCYPCYGEIRFFLDDAVENNFWFGYIQGHEFIGAAPNDYAVFKKDDGDADLDFASRVGGAVATEATAIATLAQCQWYRLGIHWDGAGTIRYFFIQDGNFPQTILATGSHTANIPTAEMSFGFGIGAGEDAAKSLYVDYVKSCQLRVIEAASAV